MNCLPAKSLLESYLDDELDASQTAHVAEHLASCTACAGVHAQLLELRAGIRAQAPYYRAPAALRERIQVSLRHKERKDARPVNPSWRWIAIAAAILLAVSAAWNIALFRSRTSSPDLIAQDVLSSHVRSLIGTHLLDVPSSDQHTVKPWFNGKLDFSPDVRDFAAHGFPLIGGRIDYVDGFGPLRMAILTGLFQNANHGGIHIGAGEQRPGRIGLHSERMDQSRRDGKQAGARNGIVMAL
jgi:anti-sigma factor RsiW